MAMIKSFDEKLLRLRKDPQAPDFILADAKDADMAFGVAAPGRASGQVGDGVYRSLSEYRQTMREIVRQGYIDIMLMSASSSERLTIEERLFDESAVTPAVRANDSTDIWLGESAAYCQSPSLPFRTTTIDHIQGGKWRCSESDRKRGANLGLYSITLNNEPHRDRETLNAYREFRHEAEEKGFRHFLEVFQPNHTEIGMILDHSRFIIDSTVRLLAGVTSASRPLFLKIPYLGPKAMARLKHYDPELIIGILGGSAGTTHDAFWLVEQSKSLGARAALFGRKINQSEAPLRFVHYLRLVADEEMRAAEAVRAYHGDLQRDGISPLRSVQADLELTQFVS
jgi:hypothetical protein